MSSEDENTLSEAEEQRAEGQTYMKRAWHRYLNDIEPTRPRLFRYCRKLSGNVWDAEDLVQETLLRGFANLAIEDNRDIDWGAYLARTASNLFIDQTRRAAKHPSKRRKNLPRRPLQRRPPPFGKEDANS